jgi:beta-lactam-binding protein with PASTA domain
MRRGWKGWRWSAATMLVAAALVFPLGAANATKPPPAPPSQPKCATPLRGPADSCIAFTSTCLPYAVTVDIVVDEPVAPAIGTLLLFSGGPGDDYWSDKDPARTAPFLEQLGREGWRIVETKYLGVGGWYANPAGDGVKASGCRPGEVANYVVQHIHTGGFLRAAGASAGSSQLAYAIGFYGFLTSGTGPCFQERDVDGTYTARWIADSVQAGSPSPPPSHSIIFAGALDDGPAPVHARDYAAAFGVPFEVVPNMAHPIQQSDTGLARLGQFLREGVPRDHTVPNVVGSTEASARAALTGASFTPVVVYQNVAQNDPNVGKVISQNPTGGTAAVRGSQVTIVIGRFVPQATVPDVRNQTETAARSTLTGAGFGVAVQYTPVASGDPSVGRVVGQNPAGGTGAQAGSTVTITVAQVGTVVPDVVGLDVTTAKARIQAVGLRSALRYQVVPPGDPREGYVVSEQPAAGTVVAPDSVVAIFVGKVKT